MAQQHSILSDPSKLKKMAMNLHIPAHGTTVDSEETRFQDDGADEISRIVIGQADRRTLAGALHSEMWPQRMAMF